MWFTGSTKLKMPRPEDALPGRAEPMPVPATHFVNGAPLVPPFPPGTEVAMFGMGCFWGAERKLWQVPGVVSTAVGYAAGYTPNPTYREVCTGRTGHNEVVRVVFDPKRVRYEDLLKVFWESHDPTQGMQQGNDVGTQYRSIILTHDDAQAATARAVMQEIADAKIYSGKLVTTVEPLTVFYAAEPEHHDYFARNPYSGYCQFVVAPKVAKFRKAFSDRLKRTAAA